MKKILFIFVFIIVSAFTFSQPLPPNGGYNHGGGGNQPGGGAPIDGGLSIMIVLGIIYGIQKNMNKIYISKETTE